jgi:hypothetical protein
MFVLERDRQVSFTPLLFHIMIYFEMFRECFSYDDLAGYSFSVTHTYKRFDLLLCLQKFLHSLFRVISAFSFKRINFILEEDHISSL